MTTQISFGQWLKRRRKSLDMTQEDLAQRIDCATVTLYKIEADERRPSRHIAELLAKHLTIPAHEHANFVRFARTEAIEGSAPWGTPFHPPTNLHAQPTLLVGREEDVLAMRKRLLQPENRLLTLIGPPGVGKTRLALEVAHRVLDDFADGVFLITLAPITDANLMSTTIAVTLGVQELGPRTALERLKAFLCNKEMLLLLDNFEQILSAAPQVAELLTICPRIRILVTSRAPLRIRRERQIPVSALELPDLTRLPDVETLAHYSAVTLFMERAQAVRPDLSLTPENALTVATICVRLDGLPLAIELISARVKLLLPAALLERLYGRLMLQSDGLRDLEPRHRTLNAAMEWSYQLLNAEEQTLFCRLGIFDGGWTLEAAQAICTEGMNLYILEGLASLLDKNLVKQDTRSTGDPRYLMLETIREYALERATASDEFQALRKRHSDYFTDFAERSADELFRADQVRWLNILQAEHDNFRAVLAWDETALRLAIALHVFWERRGHLGEGNDWLTVALRRHAAAASSQPTTEEYLTLRAWGLSWLAKFEAWRGNLNASQSHYEESLALFRGLGHTEGIADVLGDVGILFQIRGEHEQAGPPLEESLALFRELGHVRGITWGLFFLGILAYSQGEIQRASEFWEESTSRLPPGEDLWGITLHSTHLAMVVLDQGNYDRAALLLAESLTLLRQLDERWQVIHTLEVFACLEATKDQRSADPQPSLLRSARIFGSAEVLRETLNVPMMPFLRRSYERGVALLHAQLDTATLMAAWAEGRGMTVDEAIVYTLDTECVFRSYPNSLAKSTVRSPAR